MPAAFIADDRDHIWEARAGDHVGAGKIISAEKRGPATSRFKNSTNAAASAGL
jgi:hypothetical protein